MKSITTQVLFLIALAVCSLTLFSANSQAATYTVTNTANTGAGSLREAITRANGSREDDTIDFSIPPTAPNCNGSNGCTIFLVTEFAISGTSTAGKLTIINATGANRLRISGNNQTRVFYLAFGADLTLNGVTITGGNGIGVTDYEANNAGGGIYSNYGSKLTLNNSAVANNAAIFGGGIYSYNYFNGSLTMTNSTVSGNTANFGAGIYVNYGNARISNSTISGNIAQSYGGGIYNDYSSTLTLTNVTVTNNQSTSTTCTTCAGGIYNYNTSGINSTVHLFNTIVAGNSAAHSASAPDFSGLISVSSSHNIIGNNKLTTGIFDGANGNQVGTPFLPISPQLGPLQNNGGGTDTHTLQALSPAADRGSNCVLSFGGCDGSNPALTSDQRGGNYPRQSGGAVDVGAVEATQSVAGFDISGTVVYGTTPIGQPQKFVPGVTVSALGASFLSTTTDTRGNYLLRNLVSGGNYTVTPSKNGNVNGVTSFDATLVLRHVASGGTGGLTPNQIAAADTNNDGSINSFDATQILRFVASGTPSQVSGAAGNWKFVVSSRTYAPASFSISGENYDGFIVGDVNGDWTPPASLADGDEGENKLHDDNQFGALKQTDSQVQISLPGFAMFERGAAIVPLTFTNNTGAQISSFSFAIAYDPNLLQPDAQAVDFADVLSNDAGCAIVTDKTTAGRIGVAVSCPEIGITSAVTQLNLRFALAQRTRAKSAAFPALTFLQQPIFEDGNGQLLRTKIDTLSGK